MEGRVFVSYSTWRAEPAAERISRLFRAHGLTVWRDRDRLPLGVRPVRRVLAAIEASEVVVVVWDAYSGRSRWVPAEVDVALRLDLGLVVVRVEGAALPLGWGRMRAIDTRTFGPADIVRVVCAEIKQCRGRNAR